MASSEFAPDVTSASARTPLPFQEEDPAAPPFDIPDAVAEDLPLKSILGRPIGVDAFLSISLPLVTSLAAMHLSGVVHKEIKPGNIRVDPAGGRAYLVGAGKSAKVARGLAPSLTNRLVESPAYMAPEQTGRMNRSVDSRSDLYSLGIVFYEMLTGAVPFKASTSIEWVHSHVAKQAVAPCECAAVPLQLSDIVMKLLAKAAEDRYQTAAGLEIDLRRCLDEWRCAASISSFPLADRDMSPRFLIPEKLYGREHEIESLTAALHRVAETGQPGIVLLSGYSGTGKSSFAQEIHRPLAAHHGLFASGKFDQYQRDIPYATVAEAIQGLVRGILQLSEEQLEPWRVALRAALAGSGQLVVNLVPEMAFVIGRQSPVPALSPAEAQRRFQSALRGVLGVFAQAGRPLVLFLDDLQWLDTATLELLEHLVAQDEVRHMLLIASFRDNEVGPSSALAKTLEAIRANDRTRVDEIALLPLGIEDVQRLVCDALHCAPERAAPFAKLLQERAGGNPFFLVQLLTTLADECLVTFDLETARWTWNLERIEATSFGHGVLDLMMNRLDRLPVTARDAVAQLACLGGRVSAATLAAVIKRPPSQVGAALAEAIRAGLVLQDDDCFQFLHDRVQEAAYLRIPVHERARIHLHIGRLLAARMVAHGTKSSIFEIVTQFQHSIEHISSRDERDLVAELFLLAGQRAKAATAWAAARSYILSGIALLDADRWDRQYALAFALESGMAECEFLTGDLAGADARLRDLEQRAASMADQSATTALQVTLYTAMDRSDRAIEKCLAHLERVGIEWPLKPTPEMAQTEYLALMARLGDRTIEALIDLPLLADQQHRATLDVLTAVLAPAFFSDENLVCLVLCRMANLSLQYGNSDASPLAFAYLGMVIGPRFGDYRAAFRFGTLGLDLVEKRGLDRYKARVYLTFGSHVLPWSAHIHAAPALLRRAYTAANEVGDLTYGGFSSCTLITSRFAGGDALEDLQREAEARLEVVVRAKFGLIVNIITSQIQLVRALRGELGTLLSFNAGDFDEAAFEQQLQANKSLAIAECWYWIRKMQGRYFGGDDTAANIAAAHAERLVWTSSGHFESAEFHFYAALARAADFHLAPPDEQKARLLAIAAHHRQLAIWERTCPENFADRSALIAAELARIEGRPEHAMRCYERAIAAARASGFVHNEALANEVAARFYEARALQTISHALLRNARALYLAWGAAGKVRQLDRMHPHIHTTRTPLAGLSPLAQDFGHLDLDALIRTFEAVAGETRLFKLIHTLMVIALEHAGAQRGLLILPRGDRLCVEAAASVGPGCVDVDIQQTPVESAAVPQSVLHFVTRTQGSVLVDDALARHDFSADAYFERHRCRSLLCLPLIRQGELIGLLYLENNLAPRVFTPARVALLRLLASTAAVSVENATLEEKESLLREVHHRVKNNLQLISSLLSLQASRVTDPHTVELLAESRNRVRSMALVHENLYRAGNFARVPMVTHVQDLCAQIKRAYDLPGRLVGLEARVDDVQLDLDRAISCGLIINELVSNALKHGFPDGRSGGIQVVLDLLESGRLSLSITDDGVGLPDDVDPLRAKSMGLQLVQDLTQQLNGSLTVERSHPTAFTVRFAFGEPRAPRA